MDKKELGELMETTSTEVVNILASVKGLVVLAEHCGNPPETKSYLTMITACIDRLEEIMKTLKSKIQH